VSDIWIVDNSTLKVYQYAAAAGRTSGSQSAAATFALNPSDTNPQGIADPPPPEMLLTPAPAPLVLDQSSAAAPLASRDQVFALLLGESLPGLGEAAVDLPAGGAFVPRPDTPPTAAGLFGGEQPLDSWALLSAGSSQALRPEERAPGLLDSTWTNEGGPASAAATDTLFAALAEGTVTER
jgi:hypothetical protein